MAKYSASNLLAGTQQAISSSFKTQLALTASSGTQARRFKVYDFDIGTDGTPANNAMDWDISRQTAAGTSTAATPNPLDPADAAALTIGAVNFTAEGTVTAASSVFAMALNQQLSYRWAAAPGSELVAPATNLVGFAFRAKSSAYTSTALVQAYFEEQ
jgi:hypothetical protein